MAYELHLTNDIASWGRVGRTTCLGKFRSLNGAKKAMAARLRTHSYCASAYHFKPVEAS